MQTCWKIVFEGCWPDILDSVRPFKDTINVESILWDRFLEEKFSFDEETEWGCAHLPAPNLSFALGIIQATKKSVKTYLSCEMRGNGIQAYVCFGDSDEHVYKDEQFEMARHLIEATKIIRRLIDGLDELANSG